ncbi:hypothetical protein GCM10027514_10780 [Azotobacter armeniacus]
MEPTNPEKPISALVIAVGLHYFNALVRKEWQNFAGACVQVFQEGIPKQEAVFKIGSRYYEKGKNPAG